MQHDVYWHDGTPLTMADVVFTYYVLASPDYHGPRRTDEVMLIRGLVDYMEGNATSIAGLTLSNNNRTLTIEMYDIPVSILYHAIPMIPMPSHLFDGISVVDMRTSAPVMDANYIIGWGPFKIVSIVPGDAVILERNENFVWGAPYIENVRIERFPPDQAGILMDAGHFDVAAFPPHLFGSHENPTNFRFMTSPSATYNYVAFRLGTFDWDNWEAVYNPDRLMSQLGPEFRRAMGYAVNPEAFGSIFQYGFRFAAGGMSPPNHLNLFNPAAPRFTYNPERANEILDDAGFTERDADGMRMFNNEPLTLYWAMATGALAEETFEFYSQMWADVGIRVELWGGRFHDLNYLWDVLDFSMYRDPAEGYDQEIHIWSAGWSVGFNPTQNEAWGHMFWNASLYMSDEYEAILDRMVSPGAWDSDYMFQIFTDWQTYFYNNAPAFPLTWGVSLTAVNDRVTAWDTRIGNLASGFHEHFGWQNIRLTAPEPIR
jgi:peptide/nickel transport system substrate-binding protein